jgi:hypothetical protein
VNAASAEPTLTTRTGARNFRDAISHAGNECARRSSAAQGPGFPSGAGLVTVSNGRFPPAAIEIQLHFGPFGRKG